MVKIQKKSKKQFRQTYENIAVEYDKTRSLHRMGELIDRLQFEYIVKNLNLKKGMKILEAGCGTGRLLIQIAKSGVHSFGIDASDNMLNILKTKINGLQIKIKNGDIERIPYPDNSFDGVYTMHVLMHMQKYDDAIKDMYRVLKPGGIMILDFPNKNSPHTLLSILFSPKRSRTHLFTRKNLKKLFKNYNYKIDGMFSYSKFIYKIPFFRKIFYYAEKLVPLPLGIRSQYFVIVKK